MKERPILFSGTMVRALLAGTKTQTRRIVKPQPMPDVEFVREHEPEVYGHGAFCAFRQDGRVLMHQRMAPCPYGQPGDRLWVRETLRAKDGFMVYAADDGRIDCDGLDWPACIEPRKTIVSIHMPRWASRLTLEITGVRVERLQSISEADAIAEGVEPPSAEREDHDRSICPTCGGTGLHLALGQNLGVTEVDCRECDTHAKRYRHLWESINGHGSWDANPFVWVVEFKRAEGKREVGGDGK